MARPWTTNNQHPDHDVQVYRSNRGRDPIFNRDLFGTKASCSCGWTYKTNEGPPSKTTARVNAAYREHIGATDCDKPSLIFVAGCPVCSNCSCPMMISKATREWIHGISKDPFGGSGESQFHTPRGH